MIYPINYLLVQNLIFIQRNFTEKYLKGYGIKNVFM